MLQRLRSQNLKEALRKVTRQSATLLMRTQVCMASQKSASGITPTEDARQMSGSKQAIGRRISVLQERLVST